MMHDSIRIDRLVAFGIVGLHEWERRHKQEIIADVEVDVDHADIVRTDAIDGALDYGRLGRTLKAHMESAERYTIEALAGDLAGICVDNEQVSQARVRVAKPNADPYARTVSVALERTRADMEVDAWIGLGSNDEASANLRLACDRLRAIGPITAVSNVYETEPVAGGGTSGGANYLNAAVKLMTCLPAHELRRRLKAIETDLGRDPGDAARIPIDLDLCLLGEQRVETGGVVLPHPAILERGYLARTLAEVGAGSHPVTGESLEAVAERLAGTGLVEAAVRLG